MQGHVHEALGTLVPGSQRIDNVYSSHASQRGISRTYPCQGPDNMPSSLPFFTALDSSLPG